MADVKHLSQSEAATLHLHLWLAALNRTLKAAVNQRSTDIAHLARAVTPVGTLSPRHAEALMVGLDKRICDDVVPLPEIALNPKEAMAAGNIHRASPAHLPLEQLMQTGRLTPFERSALLIIVASELAPDYRRLYGYVVDDMGRGDPHVELVLQLTSDKIQSVGAKLRSLGPGGVLRRLGLILADDPLATSATTRLLPVPGLVEWLLGGRPTPPVPLSDPRMILPEIAPLREPLAVLEPAIRCLKQPDGVAALWGPEPGRHDDAIAEIAGALKMPVFAADPSGDGEDTDWPARLRLQASQAAGAGAVLWIDNRYLPSLSSHGRALADLLAGLPQRMLLTGRAPWRPAALIGARPYADVIMSAPRDAAWMLPTDMVSADVADELSRTYRLGLRERRAAVQVALSERRNTSNGSVPEMASALSKAARLVATPSQMQSVSLVEPQRTLDELILPEALHQQISEIGTLYDQASHVDSTWGFGRLTGSTGALKALFTGDPGTGKTMAAEVIAGAAGVALMKVDLSQVVSKWVGETEKNLETVFNHAEQSRAALFFDEAEALFGKRGEVRHGTDRYANLEVSYLLQRLEEFSGSILILSSNMRDEIDGAFSRRFQISLHFPRPGPEERLRLWQLAFARAPLDPGVDLARAARLELTGGAIVSTARMAALLSVSDGQGIIRQDHIDAATERQFRKEARLMDAGQASGLSVAQARV